MCKRAGNGEAALTALEDFIVYYKAYRAERMAGNEELDETFGPFDDNLLIFMMQQAEL